ncbi:MAG: class I SAM-dependent methyltransferase [Actinomycetia bacterium]|nr:class I SAM-dependent methyltransferase [Actinomycetes bacterium]
MNKDVIEETPEIWGDDATTDSATVRENYDRFAGTGSYDETFDEWGYVAPVTAAALMRNYSPVAGSVLDAACGSGLSGAALANLGYDHVTGVDISPKLLELAEGTGAYERLECVDMQDLPLPFSDDEFDAVSLIGALTYFETTDILRELYRITRSGGHIVFTQRDDIMRTQDYASELDRMEDEGRWHRVLGTEPMPYLPAHPEYGERIRVQYFVYRVA